MKILLLVMSATFVCITGLTADERQVANAQRAQPNAAAEAHAAAMAAGYHEALASYLAQGGSIRTDKRGSRYMKGPIRGLTKAQAIVKFKTLWRTTSPAVREKYAARALSRGATAEVQLEEQRQEAAKKHRQQMAEQRQQEEQNQAHYTGPLMKTGDRITFNGDQATGYRIQGNQLVDQATGMPTHMRSGGNWEPLDNSHFTIIDP